MRSAIKTASSLLQQLAHQVLSRYQSELPDLSRYHILVPNALAAQQLSSYLSQKSPSALLGPDVSSLRALTNRLVNLPENSPRIINDHARQLILLDALRSHAGLFNQANLWQIAAQLLQLFDELSLEQQLFLEQPANDWQTHLQQAYQLEQPVLPQLTREAHMVQILWRAWKDELAQLGLMDETQAYIQRLAQPLPNQQQQFILLGYEQLSRVEQCWCQQQQLAGQLEIADTWIQPAMQYPQQTLVKLALDLSQAVEQRVTELKQTTDLKSLQQHLSVFSAQHGEQEAEAVVLQVRDWLNRDKNNLAIVCEDRKLARRIRALFERDQIQLRDTAGWSLATTSAAGLLERWLECIEEDFNHIPLLDLLKSPFYYQGEDREAYLQSIYRFEQDIVYHLNISANIQRYTTALEQRHLQLEHWQPENYTAIKQELLALAQHAEPLIKHYQSKKPASATKHLDTLMQSLENTGMLSLLQQDAAGEKVIQTLQQMALYQPPACQLSWQDFRTWLSGALEQAIFAPQTQSARVHLLNLQQAEYCDFDGIILAGCDEKNLPGKPAQSPIFNQRVRKSLGLHHWAQQKQLMLTRFGDSLASAATILITHTEEANGEWQKPSPWLSSLEDLVSMACGESLQHPYLRHWLAAANRSSHRQHVRPQPALFPGEIPGKLSASQYRRLMHCPYQFFAADGLGLKAEEHVIEQVQKSDYGSLVHRILHAFQRPVKGLKPPFTDTITQHNRDAALVHLLQLSQQVFSAELEDNIVNRGWQQRWLDLCPSWLDWLIEHQAEGWQLLELEEKYQTSIAENLILYGRLDRIETRDDSHGIIDYKTGSTGSKQDLLAGEEVQLLSYSHLLAPVSQVSYVALGGDKVEPKQQLQDDELEDLRHKDWLRLTRIAELWKASCAFPAWGTAQVCQYCDMSGLCRKQIWEADAPAE